MIPRVFCKRLPGAGYPPEYRASVERFARWLASAGRSSATQRLYVTAVERWFRAGGCPGHITPGPLLRYLSQRRAACAVNTVNLDIKALRAYYRLQLDFGACDRSAVAAIPAQKRVPIGLPRPLAMADVHQVIAAIDTSTYIGRRDALIIRTLVETGLRATELVYMRLSDVLGEGAIYVHGKGGRDRYVPLRGDLHQALADYAAERARISTTRTKALWLRASGQPLASGRSIWRIVSSRFRALAGPGFGIRRLRDTGRAWAGNGPHRLRATCATELLAAGMPVTAIAETLGHADVSTTAAYAAVDLSSLRVALAHHPRANRR